MNERILWADHAKGLGILLIFTAHFFIEELGKTHFLVQLLTIGCLPVFYFTSGYFCTGDFECKRWLKHHVFTLLLPYFVASIAFWFLDYMQHEANLTNRFIGIFLQLPNTQWEGNRWFFPSFFLSKLVFDFTASRYRNNDPALIAICIGCAAVAWVYALLEGPRLPWNLEAAFLAQPFFVWGFGWKSGMEQRFNSLAKWKKGFVVVAVFVAGIVFAVLNQRLGGKSLDFHTRELNEFFSAYGASFCALFLVVQISEKNCGKLIAFIGRNSLVYYLYGGLCGAVISRILGVLGLNHWAVRYLIGIVGLALLGVPIAYGLNHYFPWSTGKQRFQ